MPPTRAACWSLSSGRHKGVPPGTLRFFTVGMAILGRFRPIFGPGGLGLADMAC